LWIAIVAALATSCGDGATPSPTGPSTPTPPAAAPPTNSPTNNSCTPSVPSGLTITYSGSSTRLFTWNASTNAVDYFIQIGSISGASDVINTNTSQTNYTWTGQSQGTGWFYARVYARNSCGSSNNSSEISFH
jgi:hypothetical protein